MLAKVSRCTVCTVLFRVLILDKYTSRYVGCIYDTTHVHTYIIIHMRSGSIVCVCLCAHVCGGGWECTNILRYF